MILRLYLTATNLLSLLLGVYRAGLWRMRVLVFLRMFCVQKGDWLECRKDIALLEADDEAFFYRSSHLLVKLLSHVWHCTPSSDSVLTQKMSNRIVPALYNSL